MDDADKPASQTKDTRRTQSQKAADEIARLTALKAEWEKFESPGEVKKRRVRQAHFLAEAMLRVDGAYVPQTWHLLMMEVASEYATPQSEESQDEQPENERWLTTREQLEADGWRFEEESQGVGRLYLPPND